METTGTDADADSRRRSMPARPQLGKAPGMKDVARLAGVSHQTVSRVLNSHPHVSEDTRVRVENAIADLKYRRNAAGRSLATSNSRTMGVLSHDISQHGPAATLLGIQQAARDSGFFIGLASISDVTPTEMTSAVEHLLQQSVEGIIVLFPSAAMLETLKLLRVEVPLVAVGNPGDELLSGVSINQRRGAITAVQHLVDLGHTRIAHVSGPPDGVEASARIDGWRSTLQEAGLDDSALISGNWSAESGYLAGRTLLASHNVTALFAANDQMALGALRAFHEAGLRVPHDISVIGYDDQPEAAYFFPPLTTVVQEFNKLGTHCVQMLLSALANGTSGATTIITPSLKLRGSTCGPRKDHHRPLSV